jgi:hypothetical protein
MGNQLPARVVDGRDRVPAAGEEEHRPGETRLGQDGATLDFHAGVRPHRHHGLGQGSRIVADQPRVELRRVTEVGELAVQHPHTVAEDTMPVVECPRSPSAP